MPITTGLIELIDFANRYTSSFNASSSFHPVMLNIEAKRAGVIFRTPSESIDSSDDLTPIFISSSGAIGVGTLDPKVQFDINSSKDEQAGTKLILRSGRGNNALQVGDSSGEIDFIIESGSFNDILTSGSLASLRADAVTVGKAGATGKLVVSVAKDANQGAVDILDWTYAPFGTPGFVQSMSSSILIKDFGTGIRSRLEFQKPDNGFVYMSLQTGSMKGIGDVTMNGTGSFGVVQSTGLTANETVIVDADGKSLTSSDLITYDTVNNRVGIGTTSPEVKLHIDGDAAQEAQIRLEQHNNTADAPDIRVRRSRGTHAAPAVLAANDYQFRLNVDIYDGTDYENAGQLRWDNDGTTDNNSTNNVFGLQTRVDGTTADRLTIDANGDAVFTGNVSGSITSTGSFGLIEGGTF